MTLQIFVEYDDPLTGERKGVPLDYDVFGFEHSRKQLWGARILRELGLILLPEFGNGTWLRIEGPDLDQLEQEAHIILDNLELIFQRTQYGVNSKFIGQYMSNLLDAIDKARAVNGVVYI